MEVKKRMNCLGLLVVDDHPVYREALSDRLSRQFERGGTRVEAASTAVEGLERVQAGVDGGGRWVVLLDILMPGLSGMAGIRAFKGLPQVAHVVAISGLDGSVWESRALSAGASLFISKNSTSDAIARRLAPLLTLNGGIPVDAPEPERFRLTVRQREVLSLIGRGHPNKIIADELKISEQTVKIHVNQIFKELRVYNRTQALLKAQEHRLI